MGILNVSVIHPFVLVNYFQTFNFDGWEWSTLSKSLKVILWKGFIMLRHQFVKIIVKGSRQLSSRSRRLNSDFQCWMSWMFSHCLVSSFPHLCCHFLFPSNFSNFPARVSVYFALSRHLPEKWYFQCIILWGNITHTLIMNFNLSKKHWKSRFMSKLLH